MECAFKRRLPDYLVCHIVQCWCQQCLHLGRYQYDNQLHNLRSYNRKGLSVYSSSHKRCRKWRCFITLLDNHLSSCSRISRHSYLLDFKSDPGCFLMDSSIIDRWLSSDQLPNPMVHNHRCVWQFRLICKPHSDKLSHD